ncbi:MAG: hypothetical protein ACYS7Y_11800 [Planctomycetota bacterium]|jgi:hypothetical protein
MNYLLIQNPGVAPVEGYTLLGMSTTRDCGVSGTIGQFGSGAKHAINLLLRAGLKLYIYCGRTRLDFFTEKRTVDDGLVKKEIEQVMCKLGGTSTKTIDCGWCLDFGAIDWDETGMALREFVSNAIDRTVREFGGFKDAMESGDLCVTPVQGDQRRAKDNFTRIYVELSPEVQKYYGELPKRFLHFSRDPDQVYKSLLPKADRNLGNGLTPMIYRGGVLVRELQGTKAKSLYDYNFTPKELSIDECRNSNEFATRGACAKLVRQADRDELSLVFKSLVADEETFESQLDAYYLMPTWDQPKDAEKEAWQGAWEDAAGDAVLCEETAKETAQFVSRKGHSVKPVKPSAWTQSAERFGIKTATQVLSSNEQKGRDKTPATEAAVEAVKIVWKWFVELEMTQGKDFPEVGCYKDIMSAESECHGFQEGNGVYLREDIADGVNTYLLKVAYEEVVHYITGATDNSRDFQNFLIDMFVAAVADTPVAA